MSESTASEITSSTSKYISQLMATINNLGEDVDLTGISEGEALVYSATSGGFVTRALVKPSNYLYVSKNGDNATADGSASKPYLTISAAITAATSGTTIFIWPGTYAESITFKAGVYLTSPVKFGVYVTGNHVANFSGTVVNDGIIFQSTSGTTIALSGTTAQNIQFLGGCSVNATAGDAFNWTNTNASSKVYFEDGTCNVTTSGASARCFYSTTGAKGSFIANRVTFKVDNYDNVCLGIGGAVSFTHTADAVYGQTVVANTASHTSAMVAHVCATVPVLTTNSTGVTTFMSCVDTTTATPAATGAGAFVYAATIFGSTGKGSAATLNGGLGAIPLDFSPIKFRSGTLKATAIDGMLEYDGTDLYFTVGTTRKKVTLVTA